MNPSTQDLVYEESDSLFASSIPKDEDCSQLPTIEFIYPPPYDPRDGEVEIPAEVNIPVSVMMSPPTQAVPIVTTTSFEEESQSSPQLEGIMVGNETISPDQTCAVTPVRVMSKQEEPLTPSTLILLFQSQIVSPIPADEPQSPELPACNDTAAASMSDLFDDHMDKENINASPKALNPLAISSPKLSSTSKEAPRLALATEKGDSTPTKRISTFSSGFITASGNKLSVSPTKLNRAKNIFQNLDEPYSTPAKRVTMTIENPTETSNKPIGFTTASGKKLLISPSKTEKARRMLQELDQASTTPAKRVSLPTVGFATASGKKLLVSPSKTDRARRLLEVRFKETTQN
ncbi:Breast cancer 2, early onset [Cichlidogyrus casuarinus]|uniref:Breast cancer 2, early onset n=1 Tax=Cichlidogyrus casuarinus TaxID=1844966 RepID=A0ABD2QA30_9PLAT